MGMFQKTASWICSIKQSYGSMLPASSPTRPIVISNTMDSCETFGNTTFLVGSKAGGLCGDGFAGGSSPCLSRANLEYYEAISSSVDPKVSCPNGVFHERCFLHQLTLQPMATGGRLFC